MAVARRLLGLAFAVFRVCYNFNVENKTPVYKRKKGISDQKGVPEKKKCIFEHLLHPKHQALYWDIFIREYLIYSVMLISGVQKNDSVTHIHISILFQLFI